MPGLWFVGSKVICSQFFSCSVKPRGMLQQCRALLSRIFSLSIKRLRCGLEKLTLWKLVDVVPVISVLMRFSMPICRSERLGRAREFVENLSSPFQFVVRPTSDIQNRSNPNGI